MDPNASTIDEIIGTYGLGAVLRHESTVGGAVNQNWVVQTTHAKIVLRCVAVERAPEDLSFEHAFIEYLAGVPVPYELPVPLKTRCGATFLSWSGRLFWAYRYIAGDTHVFDDESPLQIARAMANLHDAASRADIGLGKPTSTPFQLDWLIAEMEASRHPSDERWLDDPRFTYYRDRIDAVVDMVSRQNGDGYDELQRFPIHGDWSWDNVVFREGRIHGLLDFDNARLDTAIRDLTCYIQGDCIRAPGSYILDVETARPVIAEYRRHRPLSRQELLLIPEIAAAELADGFWWKYHELVNGRADAVSLDALKSIFEGIRWYTDNGPSIAAALMVT
ncbi:phosphotransferase [Sorangium sp. So ce1128]